VSDLREIQVPAYDPTCSICRDQAGRDRAGIKDNEICLVHGWAIATHVLSTGGFVTERSAVERERKAYINGWIKARYKCGDSTDADISAKEAARRYPLPKEE
jgi:hypothetical protein